MRACVKVAMAVCLVGNVSALSKAHVSERTVFRTADVLQRSYSAVLNSNGVSLSTPVLVRRSEVVEDAGNSAIPTNGNGTVDFTAWNAATEAACTKALSVLPRSSNPSGNCICYNLPSLDLKTGVFEADLRLYRVSNPRGDFANVSLESIKVGLQYRGAAVSTISEKDVVAMGLVGNEMSKMTRRDNTANSPRLIQTYLLVGQIDAAKLVLNMTMASLEEVLIPTFTLSATTPRGVNIKTNVSFNEASFLTGIFSNSVILSDFSTAEAAVLAQLEALQNGTIAFVLPGVQLMLFPTGAIITSVWLVLGLIAYGVGTIERMNHAEVYKRRIEADRKHREVTRR